MSSRSKMLGAGLAGSTSRRVSPNLNTAGGNKKQGFAHKVGTSTWASRAVSIHANGQNPTREFVFCVNQLGGVGVGKSQFKSGLSAGKPGGVRRSGKCGQKFMM
jgi:hypothetical protein